MAIDGPVVVPTASMTITKYRDIRPRVEESIHVGIEMVNILDFPTRRDGGLEPFHLRGKVLLKSRDEISAWYCTLDTSEPAQFYPSEVFFLLVFDHNASFRPGTKKEKEEEVPNLRGLMLVRIQGEEQRYARIGNWRAEVRSNGFREAAGHRETCLALWEEFRDAEMEELKII